MLPPPLQRWIREDPPPTPRTALCAERAETGFSSNRCALDQRASVSPITFEPRLARSGLTKTNFRPLRRGKWECRPTLARCCAAAEDADELCGHDRLPVGCVRHDATARQDVAGDACLHNRRQICKHVGINPGIILFAHGGVDAWASSQSSFSQRSALKPAR